MAPTEAAARSAMAPALLPRRVVERVYLTYDRGMPLVHLSREAASEKDPDLVASMFDAIEAFMEDAFASMHAGTVRSIEIGERCHVAFGKGRWLLLYVMYRGRESNRLEDRVIRNVHELESRFAPLLRAWNGDMGDIEPIKQVLREEWGVPEERDVFQLAAAALPEPPA